MNKTSNEEEILEEIKTMTYQVYKIWFKSKKDTERIEENYKHIGRDIAEKIAQELEERTITALKIGKKARKLSKSLKNESFYLSSLRIQQGISERVIDLAKFNNQAWMHIEKEEKQKEKPYIMSYIKHLENKNK